METTWDKLKADPAANLGSFKDDWRFQNMVEEYLPRALVPVLDKVCSIRTLMQAQYLAVGMLADRSRKFQGKLFKIQGGLSQFEEAETFLWAIGKTEQQYCHECGMTENEYRKMTVGQLRIRYFLEKHPATILAPLLRQITTWH